MDLNLHSGSAPSLSGATWVRPYTYITTLHIPPPISIRAGWRTRLCASLQNVVRHFFTGAGDGQRPHLACSCLPQGISTCAQSRTGRIYIVYHDNPLASRNARIGLECVLDIGLTIPAAQTNLRPGIADTH